MIISLTRNLCREKCWPDTSLMKYVTRKIRKILLFGLLSFFSSTIFAEGGLPKLFLFLGGNEAISYEHILKNNCINGVCKLFALGNN